jgi:hypothetical protein
MTEPLVTSRTDKIRSLDDELGSSLSGGSIVLTTSVAALDSETRAKIVDAVRHYDAFDADNDPYVEHDFGSFTADGHTVFFKIDYYDGDLQFHSPDPTDPTMTHRVLTIMLAEDY